MNEKKYNTFNIVYADREGIKTAITFNIVGYQTSKINNNGKLGNIHNAITKMITNMKSRGDFTYSDATDFIQMIIDEAWKYRIHLEYEIPTFGTFELN